MARPKLIYPIALLALLVAYPAGAVDWRHVEQGAGRDRNAMAYVDAADGTRLMVRCRGGERKMSLVLRFGSSTTAAGSTVPATLAISGLGAFKNQWHVVAAGKAIGLGDPAAKGHASELGLANKPATITFLGPGGKKRVTWRFGADGLLDALFPVLRLCGRAQNWEDIGVDCETALGHMSGSCKHSRGTITR